MFGSREIHHLVPEMSFVGSRDVMFGSRTFFFVSRCVHCGFQKRHMVVPEPSIFGSRDVALGELPAFMFNAKVADVLNYCKRMQKSTYN